MHFDPTAEFGILTIYIFMKDKVRTWIIFLFIYSLIYIIHLFIYLFIYLFIFCSGLVNNFDAFQLCLNHILQ